MKLLREISREKAKKAEKVQHLAISHKLNKPLLAQLELIRQTNPKAMVI